MTHGRAWALRIVPGVVLALLPLVLSRYYLSVVILAGLSALAAIGLNLLVGYTGQISLGHNALLGVGAYATAALTTELGWPPLVALAAGLAATTLAALGVGVPTLRLRGHSLAIGTVALGVVAHVLFNEVKPITNGYLGIGGIPPLGPGPWTLESDVGYYYVTWSLVWSRSGSAGASWPRAWGEPWRRSATTRPLRAPWESMSRRPSCRSSCCPRCSGRSRAASTRTGSTFISPELFSLDQALFLIVTLLVGGLGTFWGPAAGALALTGLAETLRVSKAFNQLLFGALLIATLLFAPRGLVGLRAVLRFWRPAPGR